MSGVLFLTPIKESTEDYEAIEKAIRDLFKTEIYLPILREFVERQSAVLKNAKMQGLHDAIRSGRITFSRGTFSGRLNSQISLELRRIGAKFDRSAGVYKIPLADLPRETRNLISASEFKFQDKIKKIDEKLAAVVPEELAAKLKVTHLFDRALYKVDKNFRKNVKNITIAPELTEHTRKRIASEWGENMQLWIQDFTKKEIVELRQNMQATILSGNRYGSAVKTIQESYGVTANKAKFLARQETSLLMTKFKQTRYQDAGVTHYKWGCVGGSKLHPVRPWHKKLEGKVFRWDDPPVTSEPGSSVRKNNPGQDYNCRCFARPMVRYTGKIG